MNHLAKMGGCLIFLTAVSPAFACVPPPPPPPAPALQELTREANETPVDFQKRSKAAEGTFYREAAKYVNNLHIVEERKKDAEKRSLERQIENEERVSKEGGHILLVIPTKVIRTAERSREQKFETTFKIEKSLKGSFDSTTLTLSGDIEYLCGPVSAHNLAFVSPGEKYVIFSKNEKFEIQDITGVFERYRFKSKKTLAELQRLEDYQ